MSKAVRAVLGLVVLAVPAVLIYGFSDAPYTFHRPDEAQIRFTFKHPGEMAEACRDLTPEEMARLPRHMRRSQECTRTRLPVSVTVRVDGVLRLERTYPPTGLWRDGPSYAYEILPVAPGVHRVEILMRDSARTLGYDAVFRKTLSVPPSGAVTLDYDEKEGGFRVR